jgi:Ca2+-binding EF-hand superfamily protein
MRALGFEVKKADVLKVMKEYDKEATGKITLDDFYEVSKYMEMFHLSLKQSVRNLNCQLIFFSDSIIVYKNRPHPS